MDFMIEVLGWGSNLVFALSGIPQAYKCFKQGHGHGLSHMLLWMWFTGELCAGIYAILKGLPTPLIINYIVNFTSLLVIMKYRYFPRSQEVK